MGVRPERVHPVSYTHLDVYKRQVLHLSNGTEAGLVLGRYWSGNNKPPEGAEGLYRKDLGRTPGEAMIRYDGSTLTIQCAGAINIEAGGAVTINGATIDLN